LRKIRAIHSDGEHRARRAWPNRRATEQRDELAPFHSITSSAQASRMSDGQRSYNRCHPSHT
jgi:hypothetical protein